MVSYVNTSADVKAESDITCTSSNAVAVVEFLGVDRVIFTPDQFLGRWVATQTDVEVILWEGSCMVHERFTGQEIGIAPDVAERARLAVSKMLEVGRKD